MALRRRSDQTPEPYGQQWDALTRAPWASWLAQGAPLGELVEDAAIPVEEYQEDDTHVVKAELPGIDPDKDVDVIVRDGALRIRAERRQEDTTDEKDFSRREIRYGSFARNLPLPAGCTEQDVTAEYHDGVLTVRLPTDTDQQSARVPVHRR